jgi:RNA polymerase sigma factor for flagellar operon FliA
MTLEELYHQSLEALPPILRALGREKRLLPEEVEDLGSDTQVKLLEDDYQVLRRWDSRSSLKVYLATVVYNLWHDRIRGEKGKVVASAAAKRLGPPALELEVLLGRQGLTFDQAYQALKPRFPGLSRGKAEEIAAQINPRPGRHFEGEDVVARQPDPEPVGDERLEQREKLVEKRKALALMQRRLSELPEPDRLLLVRAHAEGVKFSRIARSLGIDQKPLYRRNERLITKLRTDMEEAGIRWEDLSEVLGIDEPPETGPEERAGADWLQAQMQGKLDSGE